MFKKILNAIINPAAEKNSNKNEAAPGSEQMIVRPYTSQDNEEISKLLTNFDTATLMVHIATLEKVVVNLVAKVEMQSGVIVRQSEILRDMHGSLEEILNLLETATSSPQASTSSVASHQKREDAPIAQIKKTNLN